ncbi:MAG: hypothetical protein JKY41_04710 [Rhodobacteraceae bacterium]|nr:hypothetical protein [Paracoccaceae bacterium]
MKIETQPLTYGEIRAYEAKAHVLRAEAMRDGFKAIVSFVAKLTHRAIAAFSRPAHA